MPEIKRRIDNDDHYVGRNSISYIVLHDTGNFKDSDESNAKYFCTGSRGASAHYFVDDDSITQVVEDYNGAWHVGDGHGKYGITNRNSLGIEMCNSGGYISEKTIENTLWLVKKLQDKYKVDNAHVVRHYDASRKICPNNMSANNWAKWWEFKRRLESNREVSSVNLFASPNIPLWKLCINGDIVQRLQHELNTQCGAGIKEDGWFGDGTLSKCCTVREGAQGNITKIIQERLIVKNYKIQADGIFGEDTVQAIKHFQWNKGLAQDGIVGKDTWRALFKK